MTYRDDAPHNPDPHHALVGEPQHPGDALMVQSNGAPTTPLAIPATLAPPSHNVLRGGMDANTFLHALRRRWLLAVCMGTVVAVGAGIALWFIFPESSSATALFEVRNETESIVHDSMTRSTQDFDILKKTQLAYLKSKYVLTSALVNPGIASLSILAGHGDKEDWLQEHLVVDFPQNGEILSISLSGTPADDLVLLVDAVAAAYKKEVLGIEKSRKLTIKDLLERSLQNLQGEVKRKYEDYIDIAKGMGRHPGSEGQDPETQLLLQSITEDQKKVSDLTTALMQLQTDYIIEKNELNDPDLMDAMADEGLNQDPQLQMMKEQLVMARMQQLQAAGASKRGGGGHGASDSKMIDQLSRNIDQYSTLTKKKLIHDMETKPNLSLQQITGRFKTNASSLQQQLAMATKQLEQKKKDLEKRLEKSVELETRGEELKQLQQIANDMSIKLEGLDIDAEAPPRFARCNRPCRPKTSIWSSITPLRFWAPWPALR